MKVFLFSACLFLFAGDANGLRFTQERTQPESETSSSPTDFAEKDLNDIQVFVHERAQPETETSLNQTDFTEEDSSDVQQILSLLAQASEPYREYFPELDSSGLALLMQETEDEDDHLPPTPRRRGARQHRLRRRLGRSMVSEDPNQKPFDKPCYKEMEDLFGEQDFMDAFECPESLPSPIFEACQCTDTEFFSENSGGTCSPFANVTAADYFYFGMNENQTWCNEHPGMEWCVIDANDTFCEIRGYCSCMMMDENPTACQNDPGCTVFCDGCYSAMELRDMGAISVCLDTTEAGGTGLNAAVDSSVCMFGAALIDESDNDLEFAYTVAVMDIAQKIDKQAKTGILSVNSVKNKDKRKKKTREPRNG